MTTAYGTGFSVHSRPSRAITPGRKFSISTSARPISRRATSSPAGVFRSSATHFLPQLHWANVRLMPPGYVKPYVKRQKNDAADAEAICEAVTRASMRFV